MSIYDKTTNSIINNPQTTQDTEIIMEINLEKEFRKHTKFFMVVQHYTQKHQTPKTQYLKKYLNIN
jgi:hypothetical protein